MVFAHSKATRQDEMTYEIFMDLEQFVIQVQSRFDFSQDKETLLLLVGNIRSEKVQTCVDDGVTQEVAVQNKIGRLENVAAKSFYNLKPYRTFIEIEQPESRFLLRLRECDNKVKAALFPSDGGLWKITAMKSIKAFLAEKLPEVKIIT
jgi:hypothetical protein